MPSIHICKAQEKARRLGAWAGIKEAAPLWELSKRELVELAARLGALTCGECDNAELGVEAAKVEHRVLKEARIV